MRKCVTRHIRCQPLISMMYGDSCTIAIAGPLLPHYLNTSFFCQNFIVLCIRPEYQIIRRQSEQQRQRQQQHVSVFTRFAGSSLARVRARHNGIGQRVVMSDVMEYRRGNDALKKNQNSFLLSCIIRNAIQRSQLLLLFVDRLPVFRNCLETRTEKV